MVLRRLERRIGLNHCSFRQGQLEKPAFGAVAAKGTSRSKGKRSSGVLRTRDHEMSVLSRREMWHIPDPAPRMGVPWEKELRRNSSGNKNQPVALLIDER